MLLGTYQPRLEPSGIRIDNARAVDWLRRGAQPTERVQKLLALSGAWAHFEQGTDVPDEVPAETAAADAP